MEIASRNEVLRRIKRALYAGLTESGSGLESTAQMQGDLIKGKTRIPAHNRHREESQNLVDIFVDELGKVNGLSKVVHNEGELKGYLSNVTIEHHSQSCIVWETPLIKELRVIDYLTCNGLRVIKSDNKEELANADIGITEADYAIADSGTLLLFSSMTKPRLVSLIPPVHVAILDSKMIVSNIFQLFQMVKHQYESEMLGKDRIRCLTFITGPSRTADIELNLTLGVHGPKELYTIVVNK